MKSKYSIRRVEKDLTTSLTPLAQYILSEVCEAKPCKLSSVEVGLESLKLITGGWYEYTVAIKPIPVRTGGMQ